MSCWSIENGVLDVLEQKAALQILVRLFERKKSCNVTALMRSITTGSRAFYTALNKLVDANLVKSIQKYKNQERKLELTSLGKEVSIKVLETEVLLENNKKNNKDINKWKPYKSYP